MKWLRPLNTWLGAACCFAIVANAIPEIQFQYSWRKNLREFELHGVEPAKEKPAPGLNAIDKVSVSRVKWNEQTETISGVLSNGSAHVVSSAFITTIYRDKNGEMVDIDQGWLFPEDPLTPRTYIPFSIPAAGGQRNTNVATVELSLDQVVETNGKHSILRSYAETETDTLQPFYYASNRLSSREGKALFFHRRKMDYERRMRFGK